MQKGIILRPWDSVQLVGSNSQMFFTKPGGEHIALTDSFTSYLRRKQNIMT